jgi:hypothetical protein
METEPTNPPLSFRAAYSRYAIWYGVHFAMGIHAAELMFYCALRADTEQRLILVACLGAIPVICAALSLVLVAHDQKGHKHDRQAI